VPSREAFFYSRPVTPPTAQFHIGVVGAKTGELAKDSMPRDAAPYISQAKLVIPIGDGMNVSNLPSGSYRLEVQATDSSGQTTPWRTANFTIE
jgi:hypothetical protein